MIRLPSSFLKSHRNALWSALLVIVTLLGAASLFVASASADAGYPGALFGFGPQQYKNGYQYGNGVFFAPYKLTLYAEPSDTAKQVGTLRWTQQTNTNGLTLTTPDGNEKSMFADNVFFCFYPRKNVAMMAVLSDTDSGWAEVVYDQKQQKSAWVKLRAESTEDAAATKIPVARASAPTDASEPSFFNVYQTWMEFMKLNAKADGVYWLSGVSEYNHAVRSRDDDTAKLVPVMLIRDIKVRFLRGNWLLVEVLDFERNAPIGWVRWRDDDGNLMVFPNISGDHIPVMTTGSSF